MTRFQSSPPKLARNGHITSDHPHTWYFSAVRDDPWLCHDAHIFPSISAKRTPKQHWKAVGWGCHPVWPQVEFQKACLHAPHHFEKSKSPSIKHCKAVEHVARSMLGIADYAQPGQKPWSNPSLQTKFHNSTQCFYRKLFQRQPARGQYRYLVENQLDPLIVLSPTGVANDHGASWQKFCMWFWVWLLASSCWFVANPHFSEPLWTTCVAKMYQIVLCKVFHCKCAPNKHVNKEGHI